jgi:hypothetical protein
MPESYGRCEMFTKVNNKLARTGETKNARLFYKAEFPTTSLQLPIINRISSHEQELASAFAFFNLMTMPDN